MLRAYSFYPPIKFSGFLFSTDLVQRIRMRS
jgi:hypothetical protein